MHKSTIHISAGFVTGILITIIIFRMFYDKSVTEKPVSIVTSYVNPPISSPMISESPIKPIESLQIAPKQDNNAQIAALQAQYDQLAAQEKVTAHNGNVYGIAKQSALYHNNVLSQADTDLLGVDYANLFRPQSEANFQGELALFNAEINTKIEQNTELDTQLLVQMRTISDQIKSLQN